MAAALALLEGSATFAVLCGGTLFWARPPIATWPDTCTAMGQTLVLTCCFVAACYYNRLYEPRVAGSLPAFTARLPATFCLAFVLVVTVYALCPKVRVAQSILVSGLVATTGIMVGLLLPFRVVVHRVLGCRPFLERVVIVGTGPFADKLVDEIEAQHAGRYLIVGIADDERANEAVADVRTTPRSRPVRKH